MRKTMTLALASALGAGLLFGGPVLADEGAVREQVEQLLPRLQSEDDAVRERAEKELFALGEDGRMEMERLSRDADTRKAVTALRLLQSDRWSPGDLRDGERPLERLGGQDGGRSGARLDELEREMDRRFRELQRRFEDALRDVPRFKMPELPKIDMSPDSAAGSVTMQGTVIRGDRKITWERAANGKVRVSTQDGDGEERVHEADDMEAFRKEFPDVAAELDEIVPTWTGAPTVRLWDRVPDVRIPTSVWRWWHDEDDADAGGSTEDGTQQAERGPMLGIQWGPVSPLLRHHLRLDDVGVVVERVVAGSLAERLGMQPMDVLVELARTPVHGREDIGTALREAGDAPVTAVVVRRGERTTLRLPE